MMTGEGSSGVRWLIRTNDTSESSDLVRLESEGCALLLLVTTELEAAKQKDCEKEMSPA